MFRHIFSVTAVSAAAATIATLGAVAPAAASTRPGPAARPTASFSFASDRISQKTKPTVRYSTARLPRRSVITLQREFGSAHVWRNVLRLRASSGAVAAPAVPMGKYLYRIQVTKGGRTVTRSAKRPLYSYGTIPMSTLCQDGAYAVGCDSGTIQVGSSIFSYTFWDNNQWAYPQYGSLIQMNSTSCSRLHLKFATDDTVSGDQVYVEVLQARSDPQYASTPVGAVGSFSPKLDGGPFYLEDASTNGDANVYYNGTATCYTRSGKR